MSSPMLIDDSNTAVQYSPGWIWDQLVHDEVDHTRHGAAIGNITARLGFTGTGIEVFGTLEPTDHNGRPITTYSIDGEVISTYEAPFTASGETTYNVTFFSKRDLDRGDHELLITNVNGTTPNVFWLDFFLIYSSATIGNSVGVIPPSSTSTSASQPLSTITTSDGASNTSSMDGSSVGSNTSGATGSSNNVGAIVGGIIGGLALLVLIAILILLLKRRHKGPREGISPFEHTAQPHFPSPSAPLSPAPATSTDEPLHQMSFHSSTVASLPPMSVAGSMTLNSNLSDFSSMQPTSPGTTAITAVASSNLLPLSPEGFTATQAKLQESIYGSSSARSGTSTIRSTAQSDTQLISSQSETTPSSPVSESAALPVHAEVPCAPWTAPAEEHTRAQSLLRALSTRIGHGNGDRAPTQTHDVDSGLRLYSEPALPPPYTAA